MKNRYFGSSGIRGISNTEITPNLAAKVGSSLATEVKEGFITVGHDSRLTADTIEKALVSGIMSCGVNVRLLGLTPTPTLAFMTNELGAKAGVEITASHNPPEYNGLKIFDNQGIAYTEQKEREIEQLLVHQRFKPVSWSHTGSFEQMDVTDRYVEAISKGLDLKTKWNIALDLFNGATSAVIPKVCRRLNLKAALLNCQADGRFPSGYPEPSSETLHRLGEFVGEVGADLGFAYDGDGDRMLPVDQKGNNPQPDQVLAAYAAYVIRKEKGGVVVTHVEASRCMEDLVLKEGGRVVRTKVGDISIVETMKRDGAVFGGEPIGAWVHPQFHLCPDGILSSLLLLKALDEEGRDLKEFLGESPSYHMLRKKISCPEKKKNKVMKMVFKELPLQFPRVLNALKLDGLRLELDNGWVLVRASGTEPLIRLTVEADGSGNAQRIMDISENYVKGLLEAN